MENQNFSLYEQTNPVNSSLSIVFTPNSNVKKYQYQVFQDNEIISELTVNGNKMTTFDLVETGSYKVVISTYVGSSVKKLESGIYNIDKEVPVITLNETAITMHLGSSLDVMGGVSAADTQDGNLINQVTTNYDKLDFTTTGIKKLEYHVADKAGNTAVAVVNINVIPDTSNSLLVFQVGIISVLILLVLAIVLFRRSISFEKRINKYAIEPLEDKSLSIFDNIYTFYYRFVNHILEAIKKSVFLTRYAKRYDKYINIANQKNKTGLEFVASKILLSLLFIFIAIFSKTIQYKVLNIYEIVFPMLVGFFSLDLIYLFKYKKYCSTLENDLLQAIIIMNNAFKSGRSITQAIELVTTELEGPIAEEFKKMHLELTFGLAIDVVFKRFSERVKLEEITYLTASLTILNRTGGNIIKVFSSIEKSLFNKKRLKIELTSLTGSSRFIAYVLFVLPFLFALFIMLIDPTYFVVLYTTTLGYFLLGVIILMYITYIFFIRKIMKVRM